MSTPSNAPEASIRELAAGSLRFASMRARQLSTYWLTLVASGLGYGLMYLATIGQGLGRHLENLSGMEFSAFVGPGLLVGSCFVTAAGYGTWTVSDGLWGRSSFRLALCAPMTPGVILAGETIAVVARIMVQASLFVVAGLILGVWRGWSQFWLVALAGLVGAAGFLPATAYSVAGKRSPGELALVDRAVVLPMFLLAGVFAPVDALPRAVEWVAWISPVWHGTEIWRGAMRGDGGLQEALHASYFVVVLFAGGFAARLKFTRALLK